MRLEDQVCSLESSKRLNELGVKQESLFYWWDNGFGDYYLEEGKPESYDENNVHFVVYDPPFYSALTVAELGEMLPKYTHSAKGDDKNFKWECCYDCHNNYFSKSGAETEADARAKMLIYLIENGYICATKEK